jgi:arylsulfatase A-like enzyme
MKIKNGALLFTIVLLSACSTAVERATSAQQTSAKKPNVLFILADDMGFGDVGYNGSEIATPTLDQLARNGVQLDRNYVYPICSPTRAALMTGHSPLEYGIDGPMSDSTGLPLDVKIMPQYFKDMGYQTFMIGKWHLGIGNTDYWPTSRGFDYHYGFLGGWVDFYTHMYSGGLDWQRNGKSVREQGHATDLLTADAIRVLGARNKDLPFLMYLTYNAPHSPLQHPPTDSGLNKNVKAGDRAVYAEMMTHADAAIGKVIAELKQQGILDQTIVIFSSDNGGALQIGANNSTLRQGKGSTYEGGMRVPGLVSWPGHIAGGVKLEQPIAVHDWLPTLLEAVGGNPSAISNAYGQSMWDAIATGKKIDRAITTIGVRSSTAAIDWPWKVVRQTQGGTTQVSLFNVVDDPSEKNDLTKQYPEKFTQLVAVLDAIPKMASRAEGPDSPRPESFFRNTDKTGWDYNVRVPETLKPWAEAAVRESIKSAQ